VTGKDEYLVDQQVKLIVKEFLPDEDDMNKVYYDSLTMNWQMVIDDAGTFSFFGDKKVIIVENCWFLTARENLEAVDEEMLLEYLKDPNPATVLILTVASQMDGRKSLVKNIRKLCKSIELEPLSNEEFATIVRNDCKKANIELTPACLNELIARLPVDMRNWQNELKKLQLYPDTIDIDTIDQLISRNINDEVFDLSNAVLAKKLDVSLQIFNDLLIKNNDPIGLVALLSNNFRLIYQIKVWSDKGFNEREIAEEFGNIHPYRIKLAKQSARNISKDLLLEILNDFAILDYKLKSVNCDRKLEFELLLINILGKKHAFS